MSDTIYLRNLHLNAAIGPDRWHRSGKEQPVVLSLRLTHNVVSAAAKDDVDMTLNYGILCKQVTQFVCGYQGKWALNECAYEVGKLAVTWAKQETWGELKDTKIDILLPKGALRVEGGLGIEVSMQGYQVKAQTLVVKELRVPCIIGVNDHEKVEKQMVVIDLRMTGVRREDLVLNGQSIAKAVAEVSQQSHNMLMVNVARRLMQRQHVEGSAYETIEALATFIARIICMDFHVELVTVAVEKPSALPFVDGAGVEITRDQDFFRKTDVWQMNSS